MVKTRNIPAVVLDKLLVDAHFRCAICPEHKDIRNIHHIEPFRKNGPNTENNLMVVCPNCHDSIHKNPRVYTKKRIRMAKQKWIDICSKPYLSLEERIAQAPGIELKKKSPLIFIPHPYPEAPNFTGRIKERAMLTKWLLEDKEHPLLSMVAIGGMGKSALAWRWLQEDVIGEDGATGEALEGVVWWSFYEKGMTFDSFVRGFAANRWGKDSPMLSWPLSDLYNAVYQEFQQNRYLIVLDGVERILKAYYGLGSPYQRDDDETFKSEKDYRTCIEPNAELFLTKLANNITQTRTLLTTRLQPKDLDLVSGCKRLDLIRLNTEDALIFFHQQGVKGTRAEIERECEKYGYHPLSLRLLSGLIMKDPECNGDIGKCEILNPIEDMAPREHNIIDLSYNALRGNKKDFMCSLAAFRTSVDYETIKAIMQLKNHDELVSALNDGVKRGLLLYRKEKNNHGNSLCIYDMHPLIKNYFYKKLIKRGGHVQIHEKIRVYYNNWVKEVHGSLIPNIKWSTTPEKIKNESLEGIELIMELYHHTIRTSCYDEAWRIYRDGLLDPIYYYLRNFDGQINYLNELFLKNNNHPNLSDKTEQARCCFELANAYSKSINPRESIRLYIRALKILNKINEEKYMGKVRINLSKRLSDIGNFELAEKNIKQMINILSNNMITLEKTYEYWQLCLLLLNLGKFEKFLTMSKKALKSLHMEKPHHIITVYLYKSRCALLMNDSKEALECAYKALESVKLWVNGSPIPTDSIWAYRFIGASHIARANTSEGDERRKHLQGAEKYIMDGIPKCRFFNHIKLEIALLLELAKLRHLQSCDDESLKLAAEALDIANRCSYVLQQADIEQFLGEFYMDQGDMVKSRKYLEDCIEHCSHCWRYCEGEPDFDYVRKEDDFYYVKKEKKWWYRPRWEKAVALMKKLGDCLLFSDS